MAKSLAKELNYVYIDTGAMYRAATLHAMRERSVVDSSVNEVGLPGWTGPDVFGLQVQSANGAE